MRDIIAQRFPPAVEVFPLGLAGFRPVSFCRPALACGRRVKFMEELQPRLAGYLAYAK